MLMMSMCHHPGSWGCHLERHIGLLACMLHIVSSLPLVTKTDIQPNNLSIAFRNRDMHLINWPLKLVHAFTQLLLRLRFSLKLSLWVLLFHNGLINYVLDVALKWVCELGHRWGLHWCTLCVKVRCLTVLIWGTLLLLFDGKLNYLV